MNARPLRILLVASDASARCALRRDLRAVHEGPLAFTSEESPAAGLRRLEQHPFDLALVGFEAGMDLGLVQCMAEASPEMVFAIYGEGSEDVAIPYPDHSHVWPDSPGRELLARALRAAAKVADARTTTEPAGAAKALEALLAATRDGVLMLDARRRILRINPPAAALLGSPVGDLLGQPFVHPFTPGASEDVVMPRGDDSVTVRIHASRLDDAEQQTLLVLSPRNETSGVGREAELHLRDVQRMESMGKLAASLAQDWNNLLTVILGRCELVTYRVGSDETLARNLQLIQMGARRASALTQRFLSVTERHGGDDAPADLGGLLHALLPVIEVTVGSHIDVTLEVEEGVGRVRLDTAHVEQVITNLALNAREAMPHGGRLTIEARRTDLSESEARRHPAAQPGAYVCLSVSDTGAGIPAEVQDHVFEPFYTTKDRLEAHGLGLTTVRGIVQDGGGAVWLYSEQGLGTVVKLYLPVAGVLPRLQRVEPSPVTERATILLVEDEASVRSLVREVLETAGHTVIEARNGDEGFRIARDLDMPLDLIVSDVVMPGRTGPDMVAALCEAGVEPRVLFMSGYTGSDIVRRGMLTTETPYLAKPFTPDVLVRAVREALVPHAA